MYNRQHWIKFVWGIFVSLFLAWLILPAKTFAAAGINKEINFQGKLVDNNGVNVADNTYTVVFSLYNVSSGGSNTWTESDSVTTSNGIFQVALGAVTSLPGSVDFNTDTWYLGIKVGSDSEMTPRIRMTAVPYAFNSSTVNGLTLSGTDGNTYTFPTTNNGTIITSNAPTQTITSTQTSGTILGISDSTAETAALVGQSITLSGSGAFDQTGLQFNLSNASGTNLNDIVGTGSTWKISRAGVLTVASCSGCGAGGSTTLNNVTAAGGSATIANGDNPITWNWAQTSNSQNGITFGETSAATNGTAGNQYEVGIKTLASSTAGPLYVEAQGNKIIDTTATGGVTIGNATAAQTLTIDAGTGQINIGTSANAKTINIGATGAGATADTINIGTETGAATRKIFIGSGSNNSQVIFRDLGNAAPGTDWTTNGQFGLGSVNVGHNFGGRIWIRSNGNNYRFQSVANTGDYSEYMQQEGSSEPGDVMVMSSTNYETVQKSQAPYDQHVLGVVTKYGTSNNQGNCWDEVSCDRGSDPHWTNVGMLGQVYTKVSVENGTIHSGDPLTTSSVTGVAMKATEAGRIVGYALDTFDGSQSGNDLWEYGSVPTWNVTTSSGKTVKAGEILILVQASWYDPTAPPPDNTNGIVINSAGSLYAITNDATGQSFNNTIVANQAAFANLKVGGLTVDSITANAINAGIINADTINANHIRGLDVLANQVSTLNGTIGVLSQAIQSISTGSAVLGTSTASNSASPTLAPEINSLLVDGLATVSADFRVEGNGLFEGVLSVVDTLTANNFIVNNISDFFGNVIFHGDVAFNGHPTFNSDSGGFAVVKQGAQSVSITFDNEYVLTPVVTASISLESGNDSTESAVLSGVNYAVTNRTTKGFVIKLGSPAAQDIEFAWTALSIANAKTSIGDTGGTSTITPVPTQTPTPQPTAGQPQVEIPSPTPTVSPTESPTPTP